MICRFNIVIIFLGILIAVHAIKVDRKICRKKHGLFEKPGSLCKAYYQCINWVPVEWMCPPDQHFNTIRGECDWMDRFHCFEKPPSKKCPRENGRFLKPGTSCQRYIDCCNGKLTEKKCPLNQIFDTDQGKCEWKERCICIEDVSIDTSKTSVFFTTLESSTLNDISTRDNYFTESSKYPSFTTAPSDSSTVSDFDKTTSEVFETTNIPVSESVFTPIQTTSKEPFSPTFENLHSTGTESQFSDIQEITVGETVSITNASQNPIEETTVKDTFQTTVLIQETASDKIIVSTNLIQETTSDAILKSTISIRETSPEEVEQFSTTLIKEITPDEVTQSTSSNRETMTEEIIKSTVEFIETTPEEIEQISTKLIEEITPDEIAKSTTFFKETTSPEEISQSITSIREETTENVESTTSEIDGRTTMTDRIFLSTSEDVLQVTNEPNIFCPEPNGYFPHPTNKHKFIGCVDNNPHVLTCPHDLIYNHKLKQCAYQQ